MFAYRNPYTGYNSSPYYASSDNYYGFPSSGYGGYNEYPFSPYALAQAEQQRRRRALEREEAERQRAAAIQRQRASQYLPETLLRSRGYDGRGSHFPERASRYLPDEYDSEGDQDTDVDTNAYDYGFGRAGYQPESYWDRLQQRQRRPSNTAQKLRAHNSDDTHRRQPSSARNQSQTRQRTVSQNKRSSSPGSHTIPISSGTPIQRQQTKAEVDRSTPSHNPTHDRAQSHSPTRSSPSSPQFTPPQFSAPPEVLDDAATKIQTAFRNHRSLKTIQSLHDKFIDLQKSFVFPDKLDFQVGSDYGHVVSIPVNSSSSTEEAVSALKAQGFDVPTIQQCQSRPKLAYTHANAGLHAYTESLNQLLTSLDSVESFGEKMVRERRKEVVKGVEQEASKIEKMWKTAWERWVEGLTIPVASETAADGMGVPTENGAAIEEGISMDEIASPESPISAGAPEEACKRAAGETEVPMEEEDTLASQREPMQTVPDEDSEVSMGNGVIAAEDDEGFFSAAEGVSDDVEAVKQTLAPDVGEDAGDYVLI